MALTAIRELITRLGFTMDDAEARRYEQRIKKLGQTIRGYGRTMSLFVTAPIVGLGVAFVKAAADAEETENKFHEVFKGLTNEADATAKALTKDFDLATVSAQEMLASTGDILVGFGFTRKSALDLSNQVNSLAVDIASFKNVQGGAAQASNAITKALLGEREMLKGIGIAILEEDVKLKVLQLRQEGMTFETERQAKSFATLKLIIDRSKDSIGDYARTQDSATNSTRRLMERLKDLSVQLGTVLLPLYTDLVAALTSVVDWLKSFTPAGRKAILVILGIAAAIGPLLIVLGSVLKILSIIVALVGAIPVLLVAVFAAFAALGYLIQDDIKAFTEGRKSVFGLLYDGAKKMIDTIMAYLSGTWVGWIAEHVTPWINKVERLLGIMATSREEKERNIRNVATFPAAIAGLIWKPTIDPNLARLGNIQAREQLREGGRQDLRTGGDTYNIQALYAVTPPPGTAGVPRLTAEDLDRFVTEGLSRGTITPRMAP